MIYLEGGEKKGFGKLDDLTGFDDPSELSDISVGDSLLGLFFFDELSLSTSSSPFLFLPTTKKLNELLYF